MPDKTESVVYTDTTAAKLPDGVIGLKDLTAETNVGCLVPMTFYWSKWIAKRS